MQFADIVLNVRTSSIDIFTYSIPAKDLPFINPGSLVEVNFGKKMKLGVVYSLKKQLRGIDRAKIRPINKIIDSRPILDQARLDLAKKLSNYYLSSMGKTLFSMIPEPARRMGINQPIKRDLKINQDISSRSKKYVLATNFPNRLNFYQKIKKKTLGHNRQLIILVPDINSHKTKTLSKKLDINNFYYSGMNRTKRYDIWKKAQAGKIKAIIGTRQVLYLPMDNLSAVIVEQQNDDLYKNYQEPFIDYRKAAKMLTDELGITLILADDLPRYSNYLKTKQDKKWILIDRSRPKDRSRPTLINLSKEKGLISDPLKRELKITFNNQGKSILYLNRLGKTNISTCFNCGNIDYSSPNQSGTHCSICRSGDLRLGGIGIKGLAELIRPEFPKAKVITLQSKPSQASLSSLKKGSYDILISTSYINGFNLKFDLCGMILPDLELNLPNYDSDEKSFYQLDRIMRLGKKCLIQTFDPENQFYCQLASYNYQRFFKQITVDRKTSNNPPFTNLFRIYLRKDDQQNSQLQMARAKLEKWRTLKEIKINIGPITKPIFSKWSYFLIKSPISSMPKLTKKLKSFSSLKIDRDPVDLI